MHSELTTLRCPKSISRSGIINWHDLTFLSNSLRCESAAEDQAGEQYSKHGRMKELKHLFKTEGSPKILKDFLSRPIFCATGDRPAEQKKNFFLVTGPWFISHLLGNIMSICCRKTSWSVTFSIATPKRFCPKTAIFKSLLLFC